MTRDEVIDLVGAVIAVIDHRTWGDADVDAWEALVGDLDFDECRTAVHLHFRSTDKWLMPSHVRAIVRSARADRIARTVLPAPDPALTNDPGAYKQAVAAGIQRVANGWDIRRALPRGTGGPSPPPPTWRQAREALRHRHDPDEAKE